MSTNQALIDFQNIRVMRGSKPVLDDFTLRISSNEHVAILGPNGCGKSTLIKTITRECYPINREESSMKILGNDHWNVFELRTMLGIESNDLISECTGQALGRDAVLSGFFSSANIFSNHIVEPAQRKLADAALERLQIAHLAKRPVREMSSGEVRRILIARALVHQPKALLFDEPSNSLDVFARHTVRQTMSQLARSGVGIILVTHDLGDIIPDIERVVLMSNGKIVADGSKQEMLKPERLKELFGIEVEIAHKNGHYHTW
ncbi:MAG TPA: ATP-binding cassette domain-containing protein [Terriglobales bacterium]|nr:ATP-binding cassette domain-containing protein [Terriglobales bacterium]